MSSVWIEIALTALAAIGAITLHEAAHGFAAWGLGDDTARLMGRLSLNPLRHIDRFGTIILPGLLLVSQLVLIRHVAFMFGWAKPVPVDPSRFRHPRQMMALVAIAGPLMNFSLAVLAACLLRDQDLPASWWSAVDTFIVLNLVLGLFNLIPIPPLDGGRIAVGLLPLGLARAWAGLERYGIVFVLVLVAGPALLQQAGVAFDPLGSTLGPAIDWVHDGLLRLVGVPDGVG